MPRSAAIFSVRSCVTCAALLALASGFSLPAAAWASGLAGPLGQPEVARVFVERPGQLEFTGTMIVRPLQIKALVGRGLGVADAQRTHDRAVARIGRDVLRHYPEVDQYTVQIPEGMDENSYSAMLMASGDYQYAHPNYMAYPVETTPNDPMFGQQWHHVNIQSELAWDTTPGDADFITAFADTGIDKAHLTSRPTACSDTTPRTTWRRPTAGRCRMSTGTGRM